MVSCLWCCPEQPRAAGATAATQGEGGGNRDQQGKPNRCPGCCSGLERNLSHIALWKTHAAKDNRCQESLCRSGRHMVCRLDRVTEQRRLACRLPINPQAQLRHTEEPVTRLGLSQAPESMQPSTGAIAAGAGSAVPLPRLACPATIKISLEIAIHGRG